METKIERDFSGAIKKTQALKAVPRAQKKIITGWAAESVKVLKRSAADMKRSGPGRKTGDLARGVGMDMGRGEDLYQVALGTGVGGTKSVKYADIQDRGGIIRKKDKMLTIPFPGVKGTARNFSDTFFFRSAAGNLILAQRVGKKVKPLFTLKDQVTIPASHWFSGPMRTRLEFLDEAVRPENVLKTAEMMV